MPEAQGSVPRIVLIVPMSTTPAGPLEKDRGGGEEHGGIFGFAGKLFGAKEQDAITMGDRLQGQVTAIGVMLRTGIATAIESYSLDEVTVSIAVNAEGSVGVATAGVEGCIELRFVRTKKDGQRCSGA